MAEFKKLSEVEKIESTSDNATVLVEDGGEIKRVPKSELGGAGTATAIIKDSGYDNAIARLQTMTSMDVVTYECINMTFEEAYQTMASGEPLSVYGMLTLSGFLPINTQGIVTFAGTAMTGAPCILIMFSGMFNGEMQTLAQLYWTADGLSTDMPGGGQPS